MRSEPPAKAQALAAQVERDGGTTLAVYQEPVGDHWQIFCLLPRARVEASPYQRDLSPTHVKRLTETIKRLDRFVDPIVVISPKPGVYWTPNGSHRRAVLDRLRVESVPAILVVEPEVVFEVLPLNVEKAHNLKEKSLEVIRMYRGLVGTSSEKESVFAALFEEPAFITASMSRGRSRCSGSSACIEPPPGWNALRARPFQTPPQCSSSSSPMGRPSSIS